MVEAQQFGQPASVDLVTLIAFSHGPVFSWIAHHQFRDVWLQQVVQPGGRGAFFKRDVQISAQPVDKLQNHARFRLDDTFHHDLPGIIPDGNRNTFLVHVHADIFSTGHNGCSFLEELSSALKTYSKRGALLYYVALSDMYDKRGLSDSRRLVSPVQASIPELPIIVQNCLPKRGPTKHDIQAALLLDLEGLT